MNPCLIRCEQVISYIYPGDAVREYPLYLIHDIFHLPVADPFAHHASSLAEYARIRAPPARYDTDRKAKRPVSRHGEQMPRRHGDGIKVVNQRPRPGDNNPAVLPEREPLYIRPSVALHHIGDKLHDGFLALPHNQHVYLGICLKSVCNGKRYMRPAHDGTYGGPVHLGGLEYIRGHGKVHGYRGGTDDIRLEDIKFSLQLFRRVPGYDIINDFYMATGRFKRGGHIRDTEGRRRGLLKGIWRGNDSYSHR